MGMPCRQADRAHRVEATSRCTWSGAVRMRHLNALSPAMVTFLVLSTFLPSARAADEEEPKRQSSGLFTLNRFDAYLEFEADGDYRQVDYTAHTGYPRDRRQRNRQYGFQEAIGFTFDGSFIRPDVVSYRADLSFALTQDRYRESLEASSQSDHDNGYLIEYDLRFDLFRGEKLSGAVYGLRQDNRINRLFQPTLDERRTGFGTSWTYADDVLPMELSYDYLRTDRDGNRDERDDELYTEHVFHYGLSWILDEHHRVKFSYEHADTKQEFQGTPGQFETDRDLFILDHQLEFGDEYQHLFQTLVHWQEETGDFARDLAEIGPQLILRHSDALQTAYKYQFNRERYEGLDIQTHRADFQLTHQLYSNLTTTVDVFGLYEDIEKDVDTTQYGASVDWQYNRRNRWGHLYANLALAYDTERVRGDDGHRLVLDEAHTFREPLDITLRNRNVVFASILVTDTTNRRLFQQGRDYVVYQQGNVTRITRIRSGNIADGGTILVDYQYRTPADGTLDTIRVDFRLEQRFNNGLTPYYRFAYRNQEDDDISFGFPRRIDRTDHHQLGVTYEAGRFTLGAEYEIFDDTIEPYDAFHLDGLLHIIQTRDHNLDGSARVSRFFFEGGIDDRDVTVIDVELDHRWQLTEALSTMQRLAYRYQNDSVDGLTHDWDARIGFEYLVGDLTSELTLEYDRLDLSGSEEEDYGVYFRIRREIRDVLALR
jgi:hypothetical protein